MPINNKPHLPSIFQPTNALNNHSLHWYYTEVMWCMRKLSTVSHLSTLLRRFLCILLPLLAAVGASPAFSQATVTYPLNIGIGWNLLGNSLSSPIPVRAVYGNSGSGDTRFTTVWKWLSGTGKWAFYAPSPVSIWNYSVTATYTYPASTALVTQRPGISTMLAPTQTQAVVDPLAPPPTAGSQ